VAEIKITKDDFNHFGLTELFFHAVPIFWVCGLCDPLSFHNFRADVVRAALPISIEKYVAGASGSKRNH